MKSTIGLVLKNTYGKIINKPNNIGTETIEYTFFILFFLINIIYINTKQNNKNEANVVVERENIMVNKTTDIVNNGLILFLTFKKYIIAKQKAGIK